MLPELGSILVGLALATTVYAACAAFLAIRRADSRWADSSRNAAYAATGLLGLALLALLITFLDNQFQVRYVAQHSSRDLPLYLKVSALWAGQEGSLLLWAFLQALFTALVVARPSERSRPLIPWTTVFLSLITAFFVGVTLFLSNPFALQATLPSDGLGLNPLLRHPGMVFHPPALYLGYVGLAVPFAFALAALVTRRLEDWPTAARRWTVAAWLFLGLGLLLGARWAYDVLGWGGYWGWDPVENAGLMPWLTATALLHGIAMQEQRGGFRWWNVFLAVLSFTLVLFGTFTTRSGLIQSVHAFARSNLGYYFLAFIGLTLVGSLALALALALSRHSALVNPRPAEEGLLSRRGMFFLTVVLFLTITTSVLVGSVLPTLTEALTGQRFEAGPVWFDRVTGPQFAAMLLVMGVCPLLGRAASALRRLRGRGWPALLGAALVVVFAIGAGFRGWVPLVGFAVVGLAGGTALAEIGRDVSSRSRREGADPLRAVWHLFDRNRRRYGGYVVHIGVILMALGLIGTRVYSAETEVVLLYGESVDVGAYTLLFEDLQQEPAGNRVTTRASLSVYRDGAYLTTLQPRVDRYLDFEQSVGVPALRPGLREDLYLVLAGMGGDAVTLKVFVNPLASFLWLGGLVFLAGGVVAVWPQARSARLAVPRARRRAMVTGVGLAVGLLVLVAAGLAMWGPGHGAVAQASGRPLPGQTAPDFTLSVLDGSTLSLSDLRGQVVVVNFWATYCPACREELPQLQAMWEEYRNRGVVFVGVAYRDEEIAVREDVGSFGLTYPVGLDHGERIATSFGVTAVPETFVVDADGRVASFTIGAVTPEELRAEVESLVGE